MRHEYDFANSKPNQYAERLEGAAETAVAVNWDRVGVIEADETYGSALLPAEMDDDAEDDELYDDLAQAEP